MESTDVNFFMTSINFLGGIGRVFFSGGIDFSQTDGYNKPVSYHNNPVLLRWSDTITHYLTQ